MQTFCKTYRCRDKTCFEKLPWKFKSKRAYFSEIQKNHCLGNEITYVLEPILENPVVETGLLKNFRKHVCKLVENLFHSSE